VSTARSDFTHPTERLKHPAQKHPLFSSLLEQVVRKLMAADRLLAEGKDTAVCRELGVSEETYHRWRNQIGGLKGQDAKRLHLTGRAMA
jgi:hypothetical protein